MASRHRLRDHDRPVGDGAAGTTIISKNITVIFVPLAIRPPEILSASKNFTERHIQKGLDNAATGPPVRDWSMMGAGS